MFHVKQPNHGTLERAIQDDAAAIGVDLSENASAALAHHLGLVLQTTTRVNLIAPIAPGDAVRRHVIDSLTAVDAVRKAPSGEIADLGSGAGFPGIPLAIATNRPTTLIEASRKRAAFLERVIEETGAPCEVRALRSEQVALEDGARFAAVVVRAVAQLPVLVELAAPLLRPGGRFIAMKGDPAREELENGERAAELCGLRQLSVEPVSVPGVNESRVLVVYRRDAEPSVSLPRRIGAAKKRPLA